jgi:glycerol kinase
MRRDDTGGIGCRILILAIDQGTTGSTCIVFDERGHPVGRAYREFRQDFPRPGWVEHDATEIWDVTRAVANEALDSAGSGRAHLARAALEAMAYQAVDAVRAMEEASGVTLGELKADGGAVVNGWLMKFQSDVLGVPLVVPEVSETTVLGAAYLAGVATGEWSERDVRAMWRQAARYEPSTSEDERETLLAGWRRALERARSNKQDRDG